MDEIKSIFHIFLKTCCLSNAENQQTLQPEVEVTLIMYSEPEIYIDYTGFLIGEPRVNKVANNKVKKCKRPHIYLNISYLDIFLCKLPTLRSYQKWINMWQKYMYFR